MNIADEMWVKEILAEEQARLTQYQRAWDFYFGRHPQPLKVKPDQPNDNVIVNFAGLIVDKGVSFLFGDEPIFDLNPNSKSESPAEKWLKECWRVNKKMQLLQKAATNGGVCGHVFIKIVPGQSPSPTGIGQFPRLILQSPEYVHVVTDPDDIDQVWTYIIQYPARGINGERLVIRQVIERTEAGSWEIVDQVSTNGGPFVARQGIPWPYRWPPIIDCQNLPSPNEYYGIADIEDHVLKLNFALSFTLSNLQRIIRYHAHPKTIARGVSKSEFAQLPTDTNTIYFLPNANSELTNLEMLSDLSSSIEFYKRTKENLHEVARMPEVATGKVEDAGALSGVALQILYQPLVEKTKQKRLTYGEMLVELCRRLLEMGGYGETNLVTIQWPEVLPKDMLQERNAALIDKQLGASEDTLLTRLGYNPDDERKKRELNSEDMAEKMLGAFERGEDEDE